MDLQLERFLDGLYQSGREHDAARADRLERLRNLEPQTARLLGVLARGVRARRLLELGTSNGYSTIWLADAARACGAKLTSVEIDAERMAEADQNLRRVGLETFAELRLEDAGSCLARSADAHWDLIFLDAERSEYVGYWPQLARTLGAGGMLVVDNVISHAEEVAEFRELVERDSRVMEVLAPTGAGALLVVKEPQRVSSAAERGWLLDELASAGRENLDAGHVARYDTKEDADASNELLLCRELGLGRESVLVDVGAGTGQFAIAAARACARVIAVDVSAIMLERLRAKADAAGLSNLDVVQAGFLTYEHQGAQADFIYSRYALHHLPDFWKALALARLCRTLRPDGVLRLWDVVYSFDTAEAEDRLEAWCATGGSDAEHDWSAAELEEHVREESSTFSWLLEPMLERAGFRIEQARYSEDRIFAKYVLRRA